MKEKVYVLDTNIILQNLQNLYKISDNKTNHIVIPETVLLELEDKKKLSNELGYYSREFARLLSDAEVIDMHSVADDYKIIKIKINIASMFILINRVIYLKVLILGLNVK